MQDNELNYCRAKFNYCRPEPNYRCYNDCCPRGV